MSEAHLVAIEEFSKCRINFGTEYGCLSIGNILLVLGVVAVFMLFLGYIMLRTSQKQRSAK